MAYDCIDTSGRNYAWNRNLHMTAARHRRLRTPHSPLALRLPTSPKYRFCVLLAFCLLVIVSFARPDLIALLVYYSFVARGVEAYRFVAEPWSGVDSFVSRLTTLVVWDGWSITRRFDSGVEIRYPYHEETIL